MNIFTRKIFRFLKTGSIYTQDYINYVKFLNSQKSNYEKSFFNLTIDFELAWSRSRRGKTSTSTDENLERGKRVREYTPLLLQMAEKYSIPITFATVGHVALQNCKEHNKPPFFHPKWTEKGWYAEDPHTDLSVNKDYYGADLIKKILQSPVKHSLAGHSFSHVDVADSETTEEIAKFEIEEVFRILKNVYPTLNTYVFVKNHPAHKEILKGIGFEIYRNNKNQEVKRDEYELIQFPLGLWVSDNSYSPKDLIKIINQAILNKKLINFWCHLYEFESAQQFTDFFNPIFYHIDLAQKANTIEALTMENVVLKSNIN